MMRSLWSVTRCKNTWEIRWSIIIVRVVKREKLCELWANIHLIWCNDYHTDTGRMTTTTIRLLMMMMMWCSLLADIRMGHSMGLIRAATATAYAERYWFDWWPYFFQWISIIIAQSFKTRQRLVVQKHVVYTIYSMSLNSTRECCRWTRHGHNNNNNGDSYIQTYDDIWHLIFPECRSTIWNISTEFMQLRAHCTHNHSLCVYKVLLLPSFVVADFSFHSLCIGFGSFCMQTLLYRRSTMYLFCVLGWYALWLVVWQEYIWSECE